MKTKLFVGNLPFVAEEHQLQALFGADGRKIVTVQIVIDSRTKRSRGYAFVEMESERDAEAAIQALNGHQFLGRALAVDHARPPESPRDRKNRSERWNRIFD